MSGLVRLLVVLAATALLGGCIEISSRIDFNAAGGATALTEVAAPKSMVDGLPNTKRTAKSKRKAKEPTGDLDFVALCTSSPTELPAYKGRAEGTAPTSSVTTRGDKAVCSITEQVTDPVAYIADLFKSKTRAEGMGKLEPLPSGNGYRYRVEIHLGYPPN